VLFDALMLRGRYIPADIDDALNMHRRFGRCHLLPDEADIGRLDALIELAPRRRDSHLS
jgi:hypothetical protein